MKINYQLILILSITLFSCGVKTIDQKIETDTESMTQSNIDLEKSVMDFSKSVLNEKLRVIVHDRHPHNYWDIQMIFEADDFNSDHFNSYTSYSNVQSFDKPVDGNCDGVLLFATTYKDVETAQHAFQELKSNTKIRITELEGFSGLLVEQVQIFERIRKSGGMFTQKGKYVFYLLESCGVPPVGGSWNDYENLFLSFITKTNEEIEIINADCEKDVFLVQKLKANP